MDNCCLQRFLDDQTQVRIRVETEALFAILTAVRDGRIDLLNSEALEFEIRKIQDIMRYKEAAAMLAFSSEYLKITVENEMLAEILEQYGIRPMDAVHLAVATVAQADYFITCDDKLLHKSTVVKDRICKVISLPGFVSEELK